MFIRRHSVYNGGKEFGSNKNHLLKKLANYCKKIITFV
jgi:hypothetical protein